MASQPADTYTTVAYRFPAELRRSLLRQFDRRFAVIVAIVGGVLGTFTLIMSLLPVRETVTDEEILRIQERYAKLVLDQKLPEPRPAVEQKLEQTSVPKPGETVQEEEKEKRQRVDREKETVAQRRQRKAQSSSQRAQRREKIAREVQSSGIFAAITATGNGIAAGNATARDLLGAMEEIGEVSDVDISSGAFATRKSVTAEVDGPRGQRAQGVTIEKKTVGAVQSRQIASSGEVTINSEPPQLTSEPSTDAKRSQSSINRVVQRETRRLKRVYENWLKRDPGLCGQLKIKFTIMPDGLVTNVSIVRTTTNNSDFDQNILRYVKRWKFPEAPGAALIEVVYPFAFEGAA